MNDERDVLLVVLRGSAVVEVDGAGFPREAGEALVIEKGARRRMVAGPEGARVLTDRTGGRGSCPPRGVLLNASGIERSAASATAAAARQTPITAGHRAPAARRRPPTPGPTMKPSCHAKPFTAM